MTSVASSWLVYRLASQSMPQQAALVLGVVSFSAQLPVFLLAPLAGVWIDRWNQQWILVGTQAAAMLQSFALALLTVSGHITIGQIIVLSAIQGVINALDLPTRQALVVRLVTDPADMSNAIALNSSMVHVARLLGPALAGLIIYRLGEAACFFIDGFSYIAVIAALWRLKFAARPVGGASKRGWHALLEGLTYAAGFAPIRSLLMLVALTSLMAMSQAVLMPLFADRIYGGRERTLGLLLGSSGLGALAGSLYLASRRSVLGLGRVLAIACWTLGAALMAFAWSRYLPLGMSLLTISGFAMVVQMASSNTLLQTIVDDDKRGRVMSLFTMAFMGMTPFGSLLAGALAGKVGAPTTLTLAGLGCLLGGTLFAMQLPRLRVLIRPIYEARGILPPLARGLRASATEAESAQQ